jgi:hypothetical protein
MELDSGINASKTNEHLQKSSAPNDSNAFAHFLLERMYSFKSRLYFVRAFSGKSDRRGYGSVTVRPKKKFRTLPLEAGHVSAFSVIGGVFERNRLDTRTNANPAGLLVTYPSQTAAKHNIWDSNKLPQRSGQFVFRIASNEIRLNVLKVV